MAPAFCGSLWKSRRENPSSRRCLAVPRTRNLSLDEKCKEIQFQSDWNCYVDLRQTYLALKLKLVKGRDYDTYNTKEVEKGNKGESKGTAEAGEKQEEEEEGPVHLFIHVNSILLSLSISKLKSGDIITTGQCMNYQTFSKLQFRPLLRNFFLSIHIDLRDTSSEKIPCVFVGIYRLVLMLRTASNNQF